MPAPKVTTFTVRIPTDLANQLKEVAQQRGFHPAAMIRVAIERFVEDVGVQTKIEDAIPDTPAKQARAMNDLAQKVLDDE